MMMLTIINPVHSRYAGFLRQMLGRANRYIKCTGSIDIILISGRQIKELNKLYRGLPKETDVLSFVDDDTNGGEVYIADSVVRRQAKRFGNTVSGELLFVALHGILHLQGYDHEIDAERVVMEAEERRILQKLGYADNK